MYCPVCKAEYRQGITVCADCHVALAPELPGLKPGEDGLFRSFWTGNDPRTCAELCAKLEDADIPYRTIRREDHLFNLNVQPALEVVVPPLLYDKAKDVAGPDDNPEDLDEAEVAAAVELPAEDDKDGLEDGEAAQADWDPENWYPEDATVEIWSGDDSEFAALVGPCLRENRIHSRRGDSDDGTKKLFVLPEDEARAREIVREVKDATPPT